MSEATTEDRWLQVMLAERIDPSRERMYRAIPFLRNRLQASSGGRPAAGHVRRWIDGGYRLADGTVVKPECIRIGKALYTTEAAFRRFVALVNPGDREAQLGLMRQNEADRIRRDALAEGPAPVAVLDDEVEA